MAGHDDADGIGAVRQAHRPHRLGRADGGGQLAIGAGLAGGDVAKGPPDRALKHGAASADLKSVEGGQVAAEPGVHGVAHQLRRPAFAQHNRAIVPVQQAPQPGLIVVEIQRANRAVRVGHDQHLADRRSDPVQGQRQGGGRLLRGHFAIPSLKVQ